MNSMIIFTDGSSRGNPGPGGWGAVIINGGMVRELGGGEAHTTNNRMELQAAISALSSLKNYPACRSAGRQLPRLPIGGQATTPPADRRAGNYQLTVYSDSSYVVNGITKWVHGWERKGWKTADKKPVLNQDLWEELIKVSRGKNITWKHIAGHADTAGNIRADEIATDFADGRTPRLYSGVLENYRIRDVLNVAYR